MRQHTQGLLQINRTVACPYLVTEERAVAQVLFHIGSEDPEVQGNADRLWAAWNACDSIPTDCLRPGAVKVLVEVAEKALARLEELAFSLKPFGDTRIGISVTDEVWALKDILRKFRGLPEPTPSGFTQLTADDVLEELRQRAQVQTVVGHALPQEGSANNG